MLKSIKYCLIAFLTLSLLGSCVKKEARENNFTGDNEPPIVNQPIDTVYTIQGLLDLLTVSAEYTFEDNAAFYGIVIDDETSGNIYKKSFVQAGDYGVNLYFNATCGLRIGDSVCVYLKGATILKYKNLPEIKDVNPNHIKILANGIMVEPVGENLTISELCSDIYLNRLVKLNEVQFITSDLNKPFADADDSGSRYLVKKGSSDQLLVYTSNYANFAEKIIPSGSGSIIGVLGIYGDKYQLYIRSYNEVELDGPRF